MNLNESASHQPSIANQNEPLKKDQLKAMINSSIKNITVECKPILKKQKSKHKVNNVTSLCHTQSMKVIEQSQALQ